MMSTNPEEIILYDAIERAVTNVHAALAAIDSAWLGISVERPNPSSAALAALDTADEILAVAREDLSRARLALASYRQEQLPLPTSSARPTHSRLGEKE